MTDYEKYVLQLCDKQPPPAALTPRVAASEVGARYRISLPTLVLTRRGNHLAAITVAAGEIFEVVGHAEDDRFMVAKVQGQDVLIFELDLKVRGKPVHQPKVRSASA